ncbi:hypothetical protein ACHAPT_010470 [Fusarium lateritium]
MTLQTRKSIFTLAFAAKMVVGLLISAFTLWMRPSKTPLMWPSAKDIDDVLKSHDNWVVDMGINWKFERLHQHSKSYETTVTHLTEAIRYSNIKNRDALGLRMLHYSSSTNEVLEMLANWDSMAKYTVDEIQNMNDHASKLPGTWQGDRDMHDLVIREARKACTRLDNLVKTGNSLFDKLGGTGTHLHDIAQTLRDTEASLKPKAKAFKIVSRTLRKLALAVTMGHRVNDHSQAIIQRLTENLGWLRTAVADITTGPVRDMPLRLANIQGAVDKLAGAWKPSKALAQSQARDSAENGGNAKSGDN